MAEEFLGPGALADIRRSEEHTNSIQRREGLTQHPVRLVICGCPDPNCGGWHVIERDRLIPTAAQCAEIIAQDNKVRKRAKPRRHRRSPSA